LFGGTKQSSDIASKLNWERKDRGGGGVKEGGSSQTCWLDPGKDVKSPSRSLSAYLPPAPGLMIPRAM